MKFRFGLLPRVVLAIGLGVGCGFFFPEWATRIALTFNDIFGQFLSFVIPLLILGLVAPGIADLGKNAGWLLAVTAALAYAFTLFSGFGTYLVGRAVFPTQLEATLRRMVADGTPPDVITFAGNGEPTLHPEFEAVIGDTIALRDALCPSAKVSVLSNATQLHREEVRRALLRVDNNILKLDSAFDATARLMNNPQSPAYTVRGVVEQMKGFDGRLTVQTMFLRGECDGQKTDNTTEEEVSAWLRLIEEIRPRQVMVYSLDRDTPCRTLEKVPREELQAIAARVETLGIPCSVA